MTEGRCPRSGVTGSKTARRDPDSTGSGGMTSAGSRQGATDDGSRLNGGTGSNRMGRERAARIRTRPTHGPLSANAAVPAGTAGQPAARFRPTSPAAALPAAAARQVLARPPQGAHRVSRLRWLIIIIVAANAGKSPSSPGSNVAAVGTTSASATATGVPSQHATPPARPCRRHIQRGRRQPRPRHTRRAIRAGAIRASAYDCRGGGRAASFRGAS